MNAYKDKICKMLLQDNIRNRILQGELRRDKYSNDNIFEFLSLLKRNNSLINNRLKFQLITKEEWRLAVTKVQRMSILSIFLNRNYSIYKCALGSENIISILL